MRRERLTPTHSEGTGETTAISISIWAIECRTSVGPNKRDSPRFLQGQRVVDVFEEDGRRCSHSTCNTSGKRQYISGEYNRRDSCYLHGVIGLRINMLVE